MIVGAQQPCFLPWVGFWNKLASVDVLLNMGYAQYVKGEYYNRVKIGGTWATIPVMAKMVPINQIKVDHSRNPLSKIADRIRSVYAKSPHRERLEPVLLYLDTNTPDTLYQINMELYSIVRGLLGISTPILNAKPVEGEDANSRLWNMLLHNCPKITKYYSGEGGAQYMVPPFAYPTKFQKVTKAYEGESILQLIAHESDPAKAVRECAEWI